MHVSTILHQCLEPLLQHLHRRRLATLLAAVASCLSGPRLSLTELGRRRFEGGARRRHKLRRSDRLVGFEGRSVAASAACVAAGGWT